MVLFSPRRPISIEGRRNTFDKPKLANLPTGLWTRGDAGDYSEWARLVNNKSWGWEGFLPYFRKTETHYAAFTPADWKNHGYDGPVYTASVTSSGRNYPLREPLRQAWSSMGINEVVDINGGNLEGMAEVVEARTRGKRVVAAGAYSLDKVEVLSETLVKRIVVERLSDGSNVASGVELANGAIIEAKKEIVVSAGSIRTPQVLLLSGIGPKEKLSKHGIEQTVDSPEVGKNLWDHLGMWQMWKLRHPEIGASVGSPAWTSPAFLNGNPLDWSVAVSAPKEGLRAALEHDGDKQGEEHPLLKARRMDICLMMQYVGMPLDGTLISTYALNYIPTSRGDVTLASSDPKTNPLINPNHFSTEADRYRLREGTKMFAKMWHTPAGRDIVVGEAVPEGFSPLNENSTDEEIDARISAFPK